VKCLAFFGVVFGFFMFWQSGNPVTKAMLHCICTCDTQLWHFVFVTLLPSGRSRVIKKFSNRSQSKTSWPPMK